MSFEIGDKIVKSEIKSGSPEKIVKDFGLSPEEFKYDEFQTFSEGIDKENYSGYLAPCTFYKKTFLMFLVDLILYLDVLKKILILY